MSLNRYSQFNEVDDARLLQMMIEERQRSIKEKAKIFSNNGKDILIYGGINALLALSFFFGYYYKSLHEENNSKEQCKILVKCSQEVAIFHGVLSVIFTLLPIFTYLAAHKEDNKYFDFMKSFSLAITLIIFFILVAIVGYSLSCILEKEVCGILRIFFITYIATGVCFIIAVIGLVLIIWFQNADAKTATPNEQETQPINKIRNQIKYGSVQPL